MQGKSVAVKCSCLILIKMQTRSINRLSMHETVVVYSNFTSPYFRTNMPNALMVKVNL